MCCIAYQILKEYPCDFSKLSLLLLLLMDDDIRKTIKQREDLFFEYSI